MTDYRRRERKVPKHLADAEAQHEITDREKRAWQAGKNRKPAPHPELDREQQKKFLGLIVDLKSPVYFELDLGLSRAGIEHHKQKLGVETQDDARALLRRMDFEDTKDVEAEAQRNVQKQRAAEAAAQKRLEELEAKKRAEKQAKLEKARKELDANALKRDDKKRGQRQEKLDEKRDAVKAKMTDWRLEMSEIPHVDEERIALFKNDILQRGMEFCIQKYSTSSREIKAEAARLGLRINWDLVRR